MPETDPRPTPPPSPSPPSPPLHAPPPTPILWRRTGLQIGLSPGPVWLLQGPREELRQAAGLIAGTAAPDPRSAVTQRLHAAGLLTAAVADRPRPAPVIEVRGGDQLGGRIAVTAAELGARVVVVDRSPALPPDRVRGGLTADDVGLPRGATLTDRLRSEGGRPVGPETRRDLVVLCDGGDLDPAVTDPLLRGGTAHLVARRRGGVVQLGPLVLPGRTACLRCLDLHRTDADREWPALALQLLRSGEEPVDAAQALVVAGLARPLLAAFGAEGGAATAAAAFAQVVYRIPERGLPWAEPVHAHPGCGCRWIGAVTMPDRAEPARIAG